MARLDGLPSSLRRTPASEIVLFVESDDLHGLSKQSQNIDIDVCLVLCEYPEE